MLILCAFLLTTEGNDRDRISRSIKSSRDRTISRTDEIIVVSLSHVRKATRSAKPEFSVSFICLRVYPKYLLTTVLSETRNKNFVRPDKEERENQQS